MEGPRQPGRRKTIDAAQLDAELIGTAFSLFDAHGFHAVSLAAIAKQAHVAVRTIYASFGGKRGLLAALVAREHARHADQLTLLDNVAAGLDPDARLHLLAQHLRQRAGDPIFLSLQRNVITAADDVLAHACHAAGPGQFMPALECAIDAGRAAGVLQLHGSTAFLAELFTGIVAGPQLARHLGSARTSAACCGSPRDTCRVALFFAAAASLFNGEIRCQRTESFTFNI